MPKRSLQALLYALKLALTAYIIWRIFQKIELAAVLSTFVHQPLWLLSALLLLSLVRHWGQFANWAHSLQINPQYLPNRKEQLESYLIGLPLRFAVPGGSASAGKVLFVSNTSRWASLLSFGSERGFMTWTTWSYAFAAALVYYPAIPLWLRLAGFLLCFSAPLWTYYLLGLGPKTRPLQPGYARYAPRISLIQVLIAFLSYIQYWLILRQILPIDFGASFVRMALTQFSNSIPITVAGLGLRESFAIHFLAGAGFSASQAVSATLTLFIIQDLLPALPGLVLLLRTQKKANVVRNAGD